MTLMILLFFSFFLGFRFLRLVNFLQKSLKVWTIMYKVEQLLLEICLEGGWIYVLDSFE